MSYHHLTATMIHALGFQRNDDWRTSTFSRDHREYVRSQVVIVKQRNADQSWATYPAGQATAVVFAMLAGSGSGGLVGARFLVVLFLRRPEVISIWIISLDSWLVSD